MDKEQQLQVSITLESPGGTSALVTNTTEAEYKFLLRIATDMNDANPTHAAPFMNVELVD
jgi:hypothetical protein